MVLKAFEKILNNPEKMAFYNQDPILKATFMACYEYLKAGHNLTDLGWFHSPEVSQEDFKYLNKILNLQKENKKIKNEIKTIKEKLNKLIGDTALKKFKEKTKKKDLVNKKLVWCKGMDCYKLK